MQVHELLPRDNATGLDRRERAVRALLRTTVRPLLHPRTPVRVARRVDQALARLMLSSPLAPNGADHEWTEIAGVRAQVTTPTDVEDAGSRPTILYLHGGGHRMGSPVTHRMLVTRLATASGATVVSSHHRLAPEHPFPAGLDDAVAVFEGLLERSGADVVVAGDSAGGNLALALAMRQRDQDRPMPAALGLLSPWTDLRPSTAGSKGRTDDALLWPDPDGWTARQYAPLDRLDDPLVSPVLADLAGLPPMLVQVGAEELLRDDAERLAAAADEAGVDVTLERYGGMWHVHQLTPGVLPAADLALDRLAEFVLRHPATGRETGAERTADDRTANGQASAEQAPDDGARDDEVRARRARTS